MKLIIDIPEEDYDRCKMKYRRRIDIMSDAIAKGTQLPNNFDLEGLKQDMKALNCGFPYGLDYLLDCIKNRLGITIEQT